MGFGREDVVAHAVIGRERYAITHGHLPVVQFALERAVGA